MKATFCFQDLVGCWGRSLDGVLLVVVVGMCGTLLSSVQIEKESIGNLSPFVLLFILYEFQVI